MQEENVTALDRESVNQLVETMNEVAKALNAQTAILERIGRDVYHVRDLLATIEAGRSGGF